METDQLQEDCVGYAGSNRKFSGDSAMVESLLVCSDRREIIKQHRLRETQIESWQSNCISNFVCKSTKNSQSKKNTKSKKPESNNYYFSCANAPRPQKDTQSQKLSSNNAQCSVNQKQTPSATETFKSLVPRRQSAATTVVSRGKFIKSLDVLSYSSPSWRFIVNCKTYDYLPRAHPKLLAYNLPLLTNKRRPSSANDGSTTYRRFFSGTLDPATFFDDQLALVFKEKSTYLSPSDHSKCKQKCNLISCDQTPNKYDEECKKIRKAINWNLKKADNSTSNVNLKKVDIDLIGLPLETLSEKKTEEQFIYPFKLNRHRLNLPIALTPVELLSCKIEAVKNKAHGNDLYQNCCQAHESFKLSTDKGKHDTPVIKGKIKKVNKKGKTCKNKIEIVSNSTKTRKSGKPSLLSTENKVSCNKQLPKICHKSKIMKQTNRIVNDNYNRLPDYYGMPFSKTMVLQNKRNQIHPTSISLPPLLNNSFDIPINQAGGDENPFNVYIEKSTVNKKLPSILGKKVDLSHQNMSNSNHDLL